MRGSYREGQSMTSSWNAFRITLIDLAWERGLRGDWRLWLQLLEERIRDGLPIVPGSAPGRA